ncbi:helix-turn-helix domain-containing protein [Methylobacterium sp. E-005]|uniref:helix-turn-helix domain-containing protein n=1 Tax=Methylobacterium sp. E-005 TaxID=2836549 RepID=UPI001FB9EB87|nr:helix-turn-helix transcriptional regulator [Methylobacterium sp. E-005]MCJ2087004.1 helix-turn-helix domain-containing protein [Methylobacterium sp. E-005]
MPGYVFQAARVLVGLSQQGLCDQAGVSKKPINDFENMLSTPRASTVTKLVSVLTKHGVRFVEGNGVTGVVAVLTRARTEEVSRSPQRRGPGRHAAVQRSD